ncbi:MAG: phosphate transport system regulatory protein PhoU [Desulfobacteraceae bacterium]|nr:MAG: phosphate transport system regulatory protein PhoU [Desulfobacteraceae bacterium]
MEDRKHFVNSLEKLKMMLLNMATMTRRAVENANQAFQDRNEGLAQAVIDGDHAINDLEVQIDNISLKLLALEQPMARDLRFIIGAMRISNDLERIADQAVNVAERTLFLCQHPPLDPIPAMEQLMEVTGDMLDRAIKSFVEEDPKQAISIREMDDTADHWTMVVLQTLIENMVQNTPEGEKRLVNTRRSVQTIIASRCLERVGDLSTNIGEHVAFIVTGMNVKHQKIAF